MLKEIDPKKFGLNSRVKLLGDEKAEIIQIVKKRKSRIIMKDGIQLLEIANSIRNLKSGFKIEVLVSGPVCSKTLKFFENNNINVVTV